MAQFPTPAMATRIGFLDTGTPCCPDGPGAARRARRTGSRMTGLNAGGCRRPEWARHNPIHFTPDDVCGRHRVQPCRDPRYSRTRLPAVPSFRSGPLPLSVGWGP
ncbi:hypothetical protein ACFFX0_17015 [Citricoccus parietis]|uniref:Uncharacterized protein n=1 Tax=Citricoccus parietis TaxID=592307 RepID=A0ABV5G1J5_9MICC